ncbi:MAG: shikimate dehydrogenase, partial [Dehalococcoidia bacterium]
MTQTIALLGHPVAHSLSPRFQQAALDALGIDARYEAWDVPPADLPIAVERLRSGSVLGANVTVPHKVAVLRLIDRPDALAERVGAVNTIVRADGLLRATNTDVIGVLRALADAGATVAGARVVVLGAGGAGRGVVVAMREGGAAHVTIANRTLAR